MIFRGLLNYPETQQYYGLKISLGSQDGQGWLGWKGILNYLFGFWKRDSQSILLYQSRWLSLDSKRKMYNIQGLLHIIKKVFL